jgi:hypothetical protein
VSDNCGVATITNNAPASFPVGTNIVTWTVRDSAGNTATCNQTVIVTDTQPPQIVCAANPNRTVELGTSWTFDEPTATDDCGTATISVLRTDTNAGCGLTFTASRTWQATDNSGNTATCSQTVIVVDTTKPTITCAGDKSVECGAAWTFDSPTAIDTTGTNTITVVGTTTNAACGNTFSAKRTWRATDVCGNFAECSQTVTVVDTTAPVITCPSAKSVEIGTAWDFEIPTASDTCGTATVSVVGTVTNAACGNTFSATRTWRATDACGNSSECSQTVTVVDTTPPTVSIISPTNSAVFVAPATFTLAADAFDANGIAKVEFCQGTNKLGEITSGLYAVVLTNMPAGTYDFIVTATDLCGLKTTNTTTITVNVLSQPPMQVITGIHLNPRTSLYEEKVRVFNPTYAAYPGVRVYITEPHPQVRVYNLSGVTNGVPYVQSSGEVPAGSYVDFVIEFYSTGGVVPTPTLYAEVMAPPEGGTGVAEGTPQHINRGFMLANGTFQIEFTTMAGRLYAILYSADLVNWTSAQPAISGNGSTYVWIDNGQPKTASLPSASTRRFYRVILLP